MQADGFRKVVMWPNNQLLRALPVEDMNRLDVHLVPTSLKARQILHWPSQPVDHVYFIEDGLVSVMANMGSELPIEVWLIGSEGFVGLPAVLEGFPSPHRRVVQVSGHAFRIGANDLKQAMQDSIPLRRLLMRYVQANLIQASQSGACAVRHTVKQRIARWLLLAHDRVPGNQLPLTHALLSRLIGVRRATVTVSLGMLEDDGGIRQGRGAVVVVDRDRLEQAACKCYRIIASAYKAVSVNGAVVTAQLRETTIAASAKHEKRHLREHIPSGVSATLESRVTLRSTPYCGNVRK